MNINGFGFMKLDPFPPGDNPFNHDFSRMGTRLGSNVLAMMLNHHDEPTKSLVLINTETGERVAVDVGGAREPVRIQHKSPFGVSLYGLEFMEGGSYIHDWLRNLPSHSYSQVVVTDKIARLIIEDVGLSYERFGNKDFFRFTTNEEVSGFNEEPVINFLYRHDYRWYVYSLH